MNPLVKEAQRMGRWSWSGAWEDPGPIPDLSITIVIPAHNEATYLPLTLESCVKQTYLPDEIIVVDDCSTDGTGEVAQEFARTHPSIKISVHRTPVNKGSKAAAQNYALPYITTDVYATIDADTTLAPDALEKALPYFNNPNVGAVCGKIVPRYRRNFWELGRYFEYLYSFNIIKRAQDLLGAMFVASGCFAIFRTHVVREAGINQDTIAEDLHISWLIQRHKWKIRLAPFAFCYPVDPTNREEYVKQVFRWNCGFLQNIKVLDGNLFGESWKRGLLTFGALLIGFLVLLELGPVFRSTGMSYLGPSGHNMGHFVYVWTCLLWLYMSFRLLKPWLLGFLTWFYFVMSVAGPFLELGAYFLIARSFMGDDFSGMHFILAVGLSFLAKIFITWIPVIASAYFMSRRPDRKDEHDVWLAVKGIIPFSILHYYNTGIFAAAIWREFVLRKPLNTWSKGHSQIAEPQLVAADGS